MTNWFVALQRCYLIWCITSLTLSVHCWIFLLSYRESVNFHLCLDRTKREATAPCSGQTQHNFRKHANIMNCFKEACECRLDAGESVEGEFYAAIVYFPRHATCTLLARWAVTTLLPMRLTRGAEQWGREGVCRQSFFVKFCISRKPSSCFSVQVFSFSICQSAATVEPVTFHLPPCTEFSGFF